MFFFKVVASQNDFVNIRALLEDNEFKKAEKILESYEKKSINLDSTIYYQGLLSVKSGKKESARLFRDKLMRDHPNFKEVNFLNGLIYFSENDYGKSIESFNSVLAEDPQHLKALLNRALVKGLLEDYDEAIADLSKSIELAPKYSPAYYSRGYWADLAGKLDDAIKDYEAALLLDPKNIDGYLGLAHIYHKKNESEKACAVLDRAIAVGSIIAEEAKLNFCR